MPSTLATTGTGADPVTTARTANESIADWMNRHKGALASAGVGSADLVTTWNGGACSAVTSRESQTDSVFIDNHLLDITAEMVDCPPT
jgi:hypothetical protein